MIGNCSRFVLALALVAALAGEAAGAEWWVRAGASGDGATKDTPAGGIETVLGRALRGDVIRVAAGEYNGRDGTGEFSVNVPNLTLEGGWNADFSARSPFQNVTLLRRAAGKTGVNYTNTEGGIISTTPDAHGEGRITSCSGLIVDGFVIDGATRNVYNPSDHRLAAQGSWKESLIKLTSSTAFSTANIKIRNCVLMNCYNMAIEVKWMGDQNEVSNCLVFNCMIAGIDTRAAQGPYNGPGKVAGFPATAITLRNNTVAYMWDHDKAQMGAGVLMGAAKHTVQSNVFAWMTGPANAALRGVTAPRDTVRGNLFFVTGDAQALAGKDDNVAANPGFDARMDKPWFTAFTGFAGKFQKAALNVVNPSRAATGLPPIEKVGAAMPPADCAWGVAYPTDMAKLVPALVADQAGVGVQPGATFEVNAPRPDPTTMIGGTPGDPAQYAEITWDDVQKMAASAPAEGAKVRFRATLREPAMRWGDTARGPNAVDYLHVEIGRPGTQGNTPQKMFAYAVRGGQAGEQWNTLGRKSRRAETVAEGVWVQGTIFPSGQAANPAVPYVIVIDRVGD